MCIEASGAGMRCYLRIFRVEEWIVQQGRQSKGE